MSVQFQPKVLQTHLRRRSVVFFAHQTFLVLNGFARYAVVAQSVFRIRPAKLNFKLLHQRKIAYRKTRRLNSNRAIFNLRPRSTKHLDLRRITFEPRAGYVATCA